MNDHSYLFARTVDVQEGARLPFASVVARWGKTTGCFDRFFEEKDIDKTTDPLFH